MVTTTKPLTGRVALVAGGTRGARRGNTVELGATVTVTGQTTRDHRSDMARPNTIKNTAERVSPAGGLGYAIRYDHEKDEDIAALAKRVQANHRRLEILVNDVWGGDHLTQWDTPFRHLDMANLDRLWQQAVRTHIVTSQHLVRLILDNQTGLVVEITDGVGEHHRCSLGYDLVKTAVIRPATAMADGLRPHGLAAVAVTPAFCGRRRCSRSSGFPRRPGKTAQKGPATSLPRRTRTSSDGQWPPSRRTSR